MVLAHVLATLLFTNPQLDEGRALVQQLRFADARARLEAARASTTLTLDEHREVAALLAYCWAAEGNVNEAEQTYVQLLSRDARAPAPTAGPPRLRDAFRRAKERLYPPGFVSLTRELSAPGRVAVQLLDPWNTCNGGVVMRRRGLEREFTAEPLALDALGRGQAELAPLPTQREWYVEARGADGAGCATLGTAAEPFFITRVIEAPLGVPPPPRARWVPWLIVGAAVIAAALTTTFTLLGEDSLARARASRFGADIRAAELGARDQFTLAWGFGVGAGVATVASVVFFATW
jgi:hypothetical protein